MGEKVGLGGGEKSGSGDDNLVFRSAYQMETSCFPTSVMAINYQIWKLDCWLGRGVVRYILGGRTVFYRQHLDQCDGEIIGPRPHE